jgi:hypothetical protein
MSPLASVSLRAGRPGDRGSIPGRGEWIFPLATASRQALGPTQPPTQWVPAVLSPELKQSPGVTLTTHPHLVPRSRMSRSCNFSPSSAVVVCSGTALALTYQDGRVMQELRPGTHPGNLGCFVVGICCPVSLGDEIKWQEMLRRNSVNYTNNMFTVCLMPKLV